MKVFAAGIATETNTFSPLPTSLSDFTVQRGRDSSQDGTEVASFDLRAIWGRRAEARGDTFDLSLMAWAQPAGIVVRSAYESLRDEVLHDLRASMPVDVVLLMLHGAMIAQGYDDCERDLIRRVREIVGDSAVVAVELDLHCNLYWEKISLADVVITYKEYPHTDINDRAKELFDLAIATKRGDIEPTMALFDCRMIGSYPTSRQPLRGFVDSMSNAEGRNGVLSISFAHGFRSADVPHVGARILVVADQNHTLAELLAREFGLGVYALRREIGFESVSLPMEEALQKALQKTLAGVCAPVVVADQSDNIGGGAPGDATFVLRWLLQRRVEGVAMAIFYDPEVVKIAKKVGPGAAISVRLGGKMGPASGDPIDLEATVLSVAEDYLHAWPQQSGPPILYRAGDVASLRCDGIDIVVSSERCPCFSPSIFDDLGVDVKQKRILIPKSNQHFYSAFSSLASEVIYMAAPGGVPPDPKLVPYRRLDTSRLYPWADDPLNRS